MGSSEMVKKGPVGLGPLNTAALVVVGEGAMSEGRAREKEGVEKSPRKDNEVEPCGHGMVFKHLLFVSVESCLSIRLVQPYSFQSKRGLFGKNQ